jgi:hypothetical protein|tara:strand:+ start:753 stop:1736 length:984 start_codon:yes stop_codon:yes gene_type:complete
MKILFIGAVTNSVQTKDFYDIDKSALNINKHNIVDFLNSNLDKKHGVFYTSINDLGVSNFTDIERLIELCLQCDEVLYIPGESKSNWEQQLVLRYLGLIQQVKPVRYLPNNGYTDYKFELVDTRRTDEPQLWVAGCSFTSAVGVEDDQRWGQLLADKLDMQVSFLTLPGSGTRFHIDQITCSDVKENDIVVLQRTGLHRYDFSSSTASVSAQDNLHHINIQVHYPLFEKMFSIDQLTAEDHIEKTIRSFVKLQNFCNVAKAKLIMWNHFFDDKEVLSFLHTLDNFYEMPYNNFIDTGKEDIFCPGIMQHPGPKQHQAYADFLYEELK